MNTIKVVIDEATDTGAYTAGRAFLGSNARVTVSGGSFAGVTAGVSIADENGNELVALQELEQFGGGRVLSGIVLFDRQYLAQVMEDLAYVTVLLAVGDADGNVYCSAKVQLYNSPGSAT